MIFGTTKELDTSKCTVPGNNTTVIRILVTWRFACAGDTHWMVLQYQDACSVFALKQVQGNSRLPVQS